MKIAKKQRVGVVYTPLDVSVKIVPFGGASDRQVYNSATGGYYPDYEEGPLCLFPKCVAVNSRDVDGSDNDGYINDSSNFTFNWYQLEYNKTTGKYVRGNAIANGQNGFEVILNSENGMVRGMLKVNKNAPVGGAIRLEFEGKYADAQSGQVYQYIAQHNVTCDDMEESAPVLHVAPQSTVWNPIFEHPNITFDALLTDGVSGDITNADNVRFFWYRKVNVQGTSYDLQLITGNEKEDVDVVELAEKSAIVDGKETKVQGSKLTINRDLIGDGEMYVCKAMRRAALSSTDKFNERDPMVELSCVRQMPVPDIKIAGLVNQSGDESSFVSPRAIFNINGNVLTDEQVNKFFHVYWLVRKPDETEDTVVSEELNPTIEFTDGMTVGVGYEERGANKVLTASDGSYMTSSDGEVLYSN